MSVNLKGWRVGRMAGWNSWQRPDEGCCQTIRLLALTRNVCLDHPGVIQWQIWVAGFGILLEHRGRPVRPEWRKVA